MAVPVISNVTSVLETRQFQAISFQPYASGSPTSWNVSGLPTGMVHDFAMGKIEGAPEEAGVFNIAITANNDDGSSAPLVITLGVAGGSLATNKNEVAFIVDLQTRLVSCSGLASDKEPILFLKFNDTPRFRIQFVKGGVACDLDLTNLYFSLASSDDEPALVTASDFEKEGEGELATYVMNVPLTSDHLRGALEGTEPVVADYHGGLQVAVLVGEFEWIANEETTIGGSSSTRVSTQNFYAKVSKDLH